jgi:hypothetical protein
MSARRATIKELSQDEVWQPIEEVNTSEKRNIFSNMPRPLRHRFGTLSLNGHLVPCWKYLGGRLTIPMRFRSLVIHSFGGAQLTFLNTLEDKAYSVQHSKKRFFSLAWRMIKTLVRFIREHDEIKAKYRKGYPEMTTKSYWQKVLEKS